MDHSQWDKFIWIIWCYRIYFVGLVISFEFIFKHSKLFWFKNLHTMRHVDCVGTAPLLIQQKKGKKINISRWYICCYKQFSQNYTRGITYPPPPTRTHTDGLRNFSSCIKSYPHEYMYVTLLIASKFVEELKPLYTSKINEIR